MRATAPAPSARPPPHAIGATTPARHPRATAGRNSVGARHTRDHPRAIGATTPARHARATTRATAPTRHPARPPGGIP